MKLAEELRSNHASACRQATEKIIREEAANGEESVCLSRIHYKTIQWLEDEGFNVEELDPDTFLVSW